MIMLCAYEFTVVSLKKNLQTTRSHSSLLLIVLSYNNTLQSHVSPHILCPYLGITLMTPCRTSSVPIKATSMQQRQQTQLCNAVLHTALHDDKRPPSDIGIVKQERSHTTPVSQWYLPHCYVLIFSVLFRTLCILYSLHSMLPAYKYCALLHSLLLCSYHCCYCCNASFSLPLSICSATTISSGVVSFKLVYSPIVSFTCYYAVIDISDIYIYVLRKNKYNKVHLSP
jgi:hypothetical protein